MQCPNCGTQNPSDATFCEECGASLTAVPGAGTAAVPPTKPYLTPRTNCAKCGSLLEKGASFCEECGTSVTAGAPGTAATGAKQYQGMPSVSTAQARRESQKGQRAAAAAAREKKREAARRRWEAKPWYVRKWYIWPTLALIIALGVSLPFLIPKMLETVKTVDLPDLKGLSQEEATTKIESMGLKLEVTNVAATDPAQIGRVIDQTPSPGMPLREGATVAADIGGPAAGETKTTTGWVNCPQCGGIGKVSRPGTRSLQVTCAFCHGARVDPNGDPCPLCHGSGLSMQQEQYVEEILCPTCRGTGLVKQ